MPPLARRAAAVIIAGMERATTTDPLAALTGALAHLRVHDVSPTLGPDLPMWFMYEAPQVEPLFRHAEAGAAANRLTLAEHTGAHVDAPFHFDSDGQTMDQVSVDTLLLRPYKKFDLTAHDFQPGVLVDADALRAAADAAGFTLERGDVAILEMGWDKYLPDGGDAREAAWWGANQPGLAEDACEYLVEAGVNAVASDTAAADVAARDGEILAGHGHSHAFLPRGILIVEGLKGLAGVPATGLFVALPLKIQGGTGSPVRVVLLSE
jgi:kynurenine formamidase